MYVYMYNADLYYEECGCSIQDRLTKEGKAPANPDDQFSYDSGDYPVGPYPNGGGDSDSPKHCGGCGVFLENPLTSEGERYVGRLYLESLQTGKMSPTLAEWIAYYEMDAGDLDEIFDVEITE